MAGNTATFELTVKQDFNGRPIQQYLDQLDSSMQQQAIKKMVAEAGKVLAKEIKTQIARRDMPYSRTRNAASRRRARQKGQKPLIRTIAVRPFIKKKRGIVGAIAGPAYPAGAHGHLAEFGHKITGHARIRLTGLSIKALRKSRIKKKVVRIGRRGISRKGETTKAHLFQSEASGRVQGKIYNEFTRTLTAFLKKQGVTPKAARWQL